SMDAPPATGWHMRKKMSPKRRASDQMVAGAQKNANCEPLHNALFIKQPVGHLYVASSFE
ncbi:jg27599, partial [Pararge aegeria aegeria]